MRTRVGSMSHQSIGALPGGKYIRSLPSCKVDQPRTRHRHPTNEVRRRHLDSRDDHTAATPPLPLRWPFLTNLPFLPIITHNTSLILRQRIPKSSGIFHTPSFHKYSSIPDTSIQSQIPS